MQKKKKNLYGKASLKVGKTKAGVPAAQVTFLESGQTLNVFGIPDALVSGKYNVGLRNHGKEFAFATPVDTMLDVKFVKFAHQEGKKPAPRLDERYSSEEGGTYWYSAIVDVVGDEYKGLEIWVRLPYLFTDMGGTCGLEDKNREWHGKLTHAARNEDFLAYSGAEDQGEPPFRPNMLPMLQNLIQAADKTFRVLTDENGRPYRIMPSVEDMGSDSDFAEFIDDDDEYLEAPIVTELEEDDVAETEEELVLDENPVAENDEIDFDSDEAWD